MVLSQWIRRGIRRLTRPDVLKHMEVAGVYPPRLADSMKNKISKVFAAGTARAGAGTVSDAAVCEDFFRQINGVWDSLMPEFCKTDALGNTRVLVKINLNTADPYPASTDPVMLRALLLFLQERGFEHLRVGECSSVSTVPTRKVAEKTGVLDAVAGLADFVCFDEQPWLKMETGLCFLPTVTVPQALNETDFIIHLANLKTHSLADFSFGMKLGVGYMHPMERYALHKGELQEKVAELAAVVSPDLTLVDGRLAFVCGGPASGRVEAAGVILIGRNPLAVDVEAYNQLYNLKQQCGCVEGFTAEPFTMKQLAHARAVGVGGAPWQGYERIEI